MLKPVVSRCEVWPYFVLPKKKHVVKRWLPVVIRMEKRHLCWDGRTAVLSQCCGGKNVAKSVSRQRLHKELGDLGHICALRTLCGGICGDVDVNGWRSKGSATKTGRFALRGLRTCSLELLRDV